MKLASANLLLILLLCVGCAAAGNYSVDDEDGYGYGGEAPGGAGSGIGPETMLMAHAGARRVERRHWEENKWPEFGFEAVHVLSESGVAIDWAVLALKITNSYKEYDNSLGTILKNDEDIFGTELQLGMRYLFEADENVWPFLRGWLCWQYGVYESTVKDLNTGITAEIEGDGDGFGGGAGAGVVFALGEWRLELGAGYSWVRTTLDLETTIGPVTISRDSAKASVGGEPSIWLSFGVGF